MQHGRNRTRQESIEVVVVRQEESELEDTGPRGGAQKTTEGARMLSVLRLESAIVTLAARGLLFRLLSVGGEQHDAEPRNVTPEPGDRARLSSAPLTAAACLLRSNFQPTSALHTLDAP